MSFIELTPKTFSRSNQFFGSSVALDHVVVVVVVDADVDVVVAMVAVERRVVGLSLGLIVV